MIYIEMDELGSMNFEKPIEFTIDIISDKQPYTCTYKLDSVVLRSVYGEHFSSYITCNGTELGSDGEAEDRLQSFEWKKKLNDKKAASDETAIASLTNTVHTIQRNSTNNRNSYVKKITKRHTARRSSLALKVEARNLARQKAKHTNALQKSFIFSNVNTESIAEITDQMEYEIPFSLI
jgi:hypothetical protein